MIHLHAKLLISQLKIVLPSYFAADYPFINYYVIHRPHRESHEVHRRIRQRVFEAALADPEGANSAASAAAAAAAAAAALAAAAAAAAASSPTGSSKVRGLNSALVCVLLIINVLERPSCHFLL